MRFAGFDDLVDVLAVEVAVADVLVVDAAFLCALVSVCTDISRKLLIFGGLLSSSSSSLPLFKI